MITRGHTVAFESRVMVSLYMFAISDEFVRKELDASSCESKGPARVAKMLPR